MVKLKGAQGSLMKAIILIFVLGLIGVSLLGPIADEVESVEIGDGNTTDPISNVTGAAMTITNLIPLFYALVILVVFVSAVVFRKRG